LKVEPIWYGLAPTAEWQAREIEYLADQTIFSLYVGQQRICRLRSALAGEHNVKNVLAALAAVADWGWIGQFWSKG